MIKYIVAPTNTHQLFRPQTPEKKYTTFSDFNAEELLGKGGQNPINCGSSMFKDTPNLEPQLKELIQKHFNGFNYLRIELQNNEQLAKIYAINFLLFKKDKEFRNAVLKEIIDIDTLSFKDNIYEGYLFIFIATYFSLNFTLLNRSSTQKSKDVAKKYFGSEDKLKTQFIKGLQEAETIENVTALCHGRYFFLDDKLSDFNDFKPVPLRITELLNIRPKTISGKNKILFGCPGTGKSREILSIKNNLQAKEFKTTFHPDSDYSTFVGAYKPVMRGDDVRYEFMPQVFTKAYTYAWNNPNENVLLVIEEINRGNCAQIFGDLFQCLDRNANGASEYAIDAEADLAQYLAQTIENQAIVSEFFEANYDRNDCFSKIAFPPNLYIYATMNTSDQSLFPMDSAFKRRWDWQYVPIDYADAKTLSIKIDEETSYNWGDFITIINRKIYETTQSEDKQLGNRFVNPSDGKTISLEQFRSKVMFYLWSEIYKDEQEKNIFQWKQNGEYRLFTFNDLFDKVQFISIIKSFMEYNNVLPFA